MMADSLGQQILYFSNGLYIYDRNGQVMENGGPINPGYWWEISHPRPYISHLSGLSVPFPDRAGAYLYFHQRSDSFPTQRPGLLAGDIYYSHIDMTANDGLGKVVETVTLSSAPNKGFGMTKKADNRGWWLVFGLMDTGIYEVYSVDSSGLQLSQVDTFSLELPYESIYGEERAGRSLFSPDGAKFAHNDEYNGVTVLDFDRCEGKLSNPKFYPTQFWNSFTSLAFSPNSRFLYFNNSSQMMQIDTWAAPAENPVDTIANWDRYFERNTIPFGDGFAFSQLAVDGKIYVSATASSRHFHIIERPDLPGQACGFRQHAFPLPTTNGTTVPLFPNYRLAPIDCDSP